jgi:acyl carrier protein
MTIREEVVEILEKKAAALFQIDAAALSENTRFEEDLHCKSTNYVQFTAALEDEYEIEVPYMAFRRNKTLGEAGDYIEKLLG